MKISEVTEQNMRDYLRIVDDEPVLGLIREAAIRHIQTRTGLTEAQLDEHDDLSIALLVLCAEMYDNRQMTAQNDKVNPVIEQILASHAINLL